MTHGLATAVSAFALIGCTTTAATEKVVQAAELSTVCAQTYRAWTPVVGQDNRDIPAMPKPAKGKYFVDPTYKTCIVRATDHGADGLASFARHEYSRRQAFNADDSKLLITSADGGWHVYDAKTFKYLKALSGLAGDAEPQWSPTNPDVLYYVPRNGVGLKLYEHKISTNSSRVVGDFEARLKKLWPRAFAAWTHDYGSPSADGRFFAFSVADSDWKGLGIFTYDLAKDQIIATYDLPPGSPQALSTISPSGKYIVVTWGKEGGATDRFTLDFKNRMQVSKTVEHSDLGIDANGDDVSISIDYQASGGPVYYTNLRTGERTNLFTTYLAHTATAMHFSGKAFKKPGWALMSTYQDDGGTSKRQWLHRKVFAVELKPNGRVVMLAHHHAVAAGYWTEPHGSVNRDFTRVVFNSNWDNKSESDVDTYMIELPPRFLDDLPK